MLLKLIDIFDRCIGKDFAYIIFSALVSGLFLYGLTYAIVQRVLMKG